MSAPQPARNVLHAPARLLLSVVALALLWMPLRAIAVQPNTAAGVQTAALPAQTATSDAGRTAAYLDAIRSSPPLLYAFLRQMPKGGDLHNHLSGAVYAESYISFAAQSGLCIQLATMTAVAPPCDTAAGRRPVSEAYSDGSFYAAIVDAWSMRSFVPGAGTDSAHDHFFNAFGKFRLASKGFAGAELAEAANRAAAQNEQYLELMDTSDGGASRMLGAAAGWDDNLALLQQKLMDAGMAGVVALARQNIDAAESDMRSRLGRGSAAEQPGCQVTIRYLYQSNRLLPREQLFAQFVLSFALAKADPRVVGLGLVAPEDAPAALSNYGQQMSMLDFLSRQTPSMNIALHAGELTLGLVPPEDLRFHIRDAIEIGHARRIGHGTDLFYEDDPYGLLAEMVQRDTLVEISLTSSDLILGVSGTRHPFQNYLSAGVAVALSTDDEGVSRIDVTREFERAVDTYALDYQTVKMLARNSIRYSFLPGQNLWQVPGSFTPVAACAGDTPGSFLSDGCGGFLRGSERAAEQWQLEVAFATFEHAVAAFPVP